MDISLKRIVAYILDVLLITLVVTLITNIRLFNPNIDRYNELYQEYTNLNESFKKEEIPEEEYKEKIINLNYELSRKNIVTSSVTLGALIIYFGIIQPMLGGKTFGKNIMKIKLVPTDEKKKLKIGNCLLRSIILNNAIFRLLMITGVFFLNKNSYYDYSTIISFLESIMESILFAMIILRKDNRGLHDILAKTKVIDLKQGS